MTRRHQLGLAFLLLFQSLAPRAISAQETLPAPPISKYLENNFKNVQFVLLGRVTRVIQSGSFMGRTGNRYDQVEIIYSLKSISVDEILRGANFIKNKRSILLAESRICNIGCPGSHIDDDKARSVKESFSVDKVKSVFLICWSQGSADYIFDLVLRLRRELRKQGHSYDYAVFENCGLSDHQNPETVSAVQSYFNVPREKINRARKAIDDDSIDTLQQR
jgi:hypothetical protein